MSLRNITPSGNLLPGLLTDDIEFFASQDQVQLLNRGQVLSVDKAPAGILQKVKDLIHDELGAVEILQYWYPNNTSQQLNKFLDCRYGGLDLTPDYVNGNFQDGEFKPCPMRGTCIGEGIICKFPSYNGHRLDKESIDLMQALCSAKTNEAIIDDLGYAAGTFHLKKKNLYKRLGVQTKQELALIARDLNIV